MQQVRYQLRDLLEDMLGATHLTEFLEQILTGAAFTFVLRVTFTGLLFVTSILLARFLGAAGYGVYAYAITWINLLTVPALFGLDQLLTRQVAAYFKLQNWPALFGLVRWAHRVGLATSVGLSVIAMGTAWLLRPYIEEAMIGALSIALLMLPFVTLSRIRQASLIGLQHVVVGQIPDFLIQPALFIVLVGAGHWLFHESLNGNVAVGLQVVAAAVAFVVGYRQLQVRLPKLGARLRPVYEWRSWARSALYMFSVSALFVLNARLDTLFLGPLQGAEAVGIYVAASRGAELILFVMTAVNTALAPRAANLYASREIAHLQQIITKSARVMVIGSLPIALFLLLFGQWYLALFGTEFVAGRLSLSILSFGQMANVLMGPVGLLLMMSGHELDAVKGAGAGTIVNVILNLTLIPRWGLEGAATATATSIAIANVVLAILVVRRLGIHPTAAGAFSLRRRK